MTKNTSPRAAMLAIRKTMKFKAVTPLAMVMTFADWRLNPGGIFHSEQGTDWAIVWDTLVSWFVPTIPAAVILSVAVLFLVLPRR